MKISVIIPAYNAETFLAQTLGSVQAQTYPDWELVIVDDGSQDRTVAVAQEFAARDGRIRVITQPNGGVAAARNRGLAEIHASSEYVILLDHDDLWHPGTLETLLQALEDNPRAVGAHGCALGVAVGDMSQGFDAGDGTEVWQRRKMVRRFGVIRTVVCSRTEPTTFNAQVYDGCIGTPGLMLARRRDIEAIGRFDPATTPCDDWDFWVRLSLRGEAVFVDRVLLNWRRHGGNASLNKRYMGHGVSQIRRKMLGLPGMTTEQRALAFWRYRRMYASVERHNAQDCLRWARERLGCRDFLGCLADLRRSVGFYRRYVSLVLFWGPTMDRGPIPERLADSRKADPAAPQAHAAPVS